MTALLTFAKLQYFASSPVALIARSYRVTDEASIAEIAV